MATRDLWHLGFARLVRQRAPPGFVVRAEVPLSEEPQRADLILIRREDVPRSDGEAQVLRALWPHLGKDTVLEFKSPTRGFRRADLMRLVSYGAQYHVLENERLCSPSDLTLVLVVPSRNAALDDEINRMGLRLTLLGGGYGRIDGGVYTVFLVITDEVSDEERDDFLRIFSHHDPQTKEAAWWWQEWRAEDLTMPDVKTMEGYDELTEKFVNSLTLEQRLHGLSPEQRAVGLSLEERFLIVPEDALRALSDDYIRSLPADARDAIYKRIGRPKP